MAENQWIRKMEAEDTSSLHARPHTGRPADLSREQKELIPDHLSHGAEA